MTLKGRKRFLSKIKYGNSKEKSKAQRQAVNSICQVEFLSFLFFLDSFLKMFLSFQHLVKVVGINIVLFAVLGICC